MTRDAASGCERPGICAHRAPQYLIPAPPIRHSREGGNPRPRLSRQNVPHHIRHSSPPPVIPAKAGTHVTPVPHAVYRAQHPTSLHLIATKTTRQPPSRSRRTPEANTQSTQSHRRSRHEVRKTVESILGMLRQIDFRVCYLCLAAPPRPSQPIFGFLYQASSYFLRPVLVETYRSASTPNKSCTIRY